MTEDEYPADPAVRKVYQWIERLTVKNCNRAVFTTSGTFRMYAERYPKIPKSRWEIIGNGYDEEDFIACEKTTFKRSLSKGRVILVHSGLLYPSERDPGAFFAALASLRRDGKISSSNLKIVLRGSGDEKFYSQLIRENSIEDLVFLEPSIPHHEALLEVLNADGLLVFQASNCNHQIPAKVYEYLRAERPIFAMTDPAGDTAGVLKEAGIDTVVPLDSKEEIAHGLLSFLSKIRQGGGYVGRNKEIGHYSRRARTKELAQLLNSI